MSIDSYANIYEANIYGALIVDYVCTQHKRSSYWSNLIKRTSDPLQIDDVVTRVAKHLFLNKIEKKALRHFFEATPSAYEALKKEGLKFSAEQLNVIHQYLENQLAKIDQANYFYPFSLDKLNQDINKVQNSTTRKTLEGLLKEFTTEPEKRTSRIKMAQKTFPKGYLASISQNLGKESTPEIENFLGFIEHQVPRMLYLQTKIAELAKSQLAAGHAPQTLPLNYTFAKSSAGGHARRPLPNRTVIAAGKDGQGSPPREESKIYWIVQKIQTIFFYILDTIAAFCGRIRQAWIDRNRISPPGEA